MRNRTADLLLTMETLCLLSYRGAQMPLGGRHQRTKIHTARRRGPIQRQPGDRGHWSIQSRVNGRFHRPTNGRYGQFMNPPVPAGMDGKASDALLKLGRVFTRWEESDDGRVAFRKGGRAGDVFYRDRWSHEKVVRSTHGVNCTGSCSWKIYVRDGIITWEAQQTDYPSVGPDRPEYEPRGCPRGAAFSWYT